MFVYLLKPTHRNTPCQCAKAIQGRFTVRELFQDERKQPCSFSDLPCVGRTCRLFDDLLHRWCSLHGFQSLLSATPEAIETPLPRESRTALPVAILNALRYQRRCLLYDAWEKQCKQFSFSEHGARARPR